MGKHTAPFFAYLPFAFWCKDRERFNSILIPYSSGEIRAIWVITRPVLEIGPKNP